MKRWVIFFSLLLPVLSAHAEEAGLKAGSQAPEFVATTHHNEKVVLSELLAGGPVVLVFYRGGWCYYCNLQLQELQKNIDAIHAEGARLVAISVDLQESAAKTVEEQKLDFTVVSNPEADLLEQYRVVFYVPDDLEKKYREEYDIDLVAASGRKDFLVAIPATYVLDAEGKITYAYVDKNYKARPPVEDVLVALKTLNEN